jgi:hypothetical protein
MTIATIATKEEAARDSWREYQAVKQARAHLDAVLDAHAEIELRFQQDASCLNPEVANIQHPSAEQIWTAKTRIVDDAKRHAESCIQRVAARQALEAASETAKNAWVRAKTAELISEAKLAGADLLKARAHMMNIASLEQYMHSEAGAPIGLAWPQLLPGGFLDTWLASLDGRPMIPAGTFTIPEPDPAEVRRHKIASDRWNSGDHNNPSAADLEREAKG